MSQDQAGRHMDAAALNSPLESKYAPLLAILYDENKVDVFRGNEYLQRKQLVISQWSNQKSNSQGFLVLLPYSDFLVVAKQGETKIYFKNYIEINKNDRTLETALRSIIHISLSPEHKIITVFDWELTALIQFNVPEISCGHDPLIVSCSSLLLNDQIECIEHAVFNQVDKKCFCKGGYYLDINTRTCKKCQCFEKGHYCQNSATDCYEDSFYQINLEKDEDVVGRSC
jgi:hypothetical protein